MEILLGREESRPYWEIHRVPEGWGNMNDKAIRKGIQLRSIEIHLGREESRPYWGIGRNEYGCGMNIETGMNVEKRRRGEFEGYRMVIY